MPIWGGVVENYCFYVTKDHFILGNGKPQYYKL